MSDDVELYDIPPAFQNRLLRWLGQPGALIDIKVRDEKFVVYGRIDPGGSSDDVVEHKSLERALNAAMGSRARAGHIKPAFDRRVRKWLSERDGSIVLRAQNDDFLLALVVPGASIETSDRDLEVALVLAEDELEVQSLAAPETDPETLVAPTRAASTRRTVDDEPETEAAPTRALSTRAAKTRLFGGDTDRTMREAGLQENARWSRAYIDSLPDRAFLHVETGGKKDSIGRSHPLSLRHFPYKNRTGRIDRSHLKAALSRAHQKKTKLPERTKEQVFRHAQEIYRREFGDDLAANATPPRKQHASFRGRELPTTRQLVEREEARERREQRPFDPEARRESYTKPHHFAVNARDGSQEVGHIGDVNWPEYSGGPVFVDQSTGQADLEYVEPPDTEFGDPKARWTVYRVALDPEVPSWGKLNDVAKTTDQDPKELRAAFVSDDPMARAFAYETWAAHYGWHEFDQYPLELTLADMNARYKADLEPNHGRERHEDKDILREVMLGDTGYVLVLWDTNQADRHGKSVLGYAFYAPGDPEPLFEGEDYGASPMHAVDSDESVRGLLGFLTLRPGDTDRSYFDGYSERQMDFTKGDAESLSMFGMEPDSEFEPPALVDVA